MTAAPDASVTDTSWPDATSDTNADGTQMCFADFPCRDGETMRCIDGTHYVTLQTHDCHHACGPGPCSGGTCDAVGNEQACPAGQSCIKEHGPEQFDHCGDPDAGVDAPPEASTGPCGDGFCRSAVMSSCGDPAFYEMPIWECTTTASTQGYCCLPKAGCVSGYCTTTSECMQPLMLTQVACAIDAGSGSCCVEPK